MPETSISRIEMIAWSRYVHELCGVFLDETKGYLIETRLGGLLRETACGGWDELLFKAKRADGHSLRTRIVSASTTNETSFFRDSAPFDLLRHKLLPELIDRRRRAGMAVVPIRILSAACSTGQEAYSVAMTMKELLGSLSNYDVRILGLDISDAAVAQASYGHFSQLEVARGLSAERLTRHFEALGERWKIRDELRALATFRRANLLEPISTPFPFDLVFCRNVAIYFTEPDKIRLFRNLGKSMARDGALIVGSTESISGLCPEFKPQRHLRSVFYTRDGADASVRNA
jgi:chemotaxis protein methyltransferase CheR